MQIYNGISEKFTISFEFRKKKGGRSDSRRDILQNFHYRICDISRIVSNPRSCA